MNKTLNYFECEKIVAEKLGYKMIDSLKLDLLIFLFPNIKKCDKISINNELLSRYSNSKWRRDVIKMFISEFGEDAIYKADW